jgi:hypothetical protein
MAGMGFVQSYGGLLTTSFILGMIEAGFKPGMTLRNHYKLYLWVGGVIFYMSMGYRREELQFRVALFFTSTGIAGIVYYSVLKDINDRM